MTSTFARLSLQPSTAKRVGSRLAKSGESPVELKEMVNTLWPVLTDPPLPLQACSLDAVRGDFCISLEGYTVADGRLALLLELADPKSHVSVAGRVLSGGSDLRWAAFVGKGLARGIQTVHAAGRIHRDVKPENLLLQDGAPKLADFGAAAMGKRVEGLVRSPSFCHRYPFLVQTKSPPLWRCRGALLPYPELLFSGGALDDGPAHELQDLQLHSFHRNVDVLFFPFLGAFPNC